MLLFAQLSEAWGTPSDPSRRLDSRVGLGFRVWGLGFRVWGLGFRIWGWVVRAQAQAYVGVAGSRFHARAGFPKILQSLDL